MPAKQVIVIRRDLSMPPGKAASQAAHAAISFLSKHVRNGYGYDNLWPAAREWLAADFTKICLAVNSEEELYLLHQSALEKGLVSNMIVDNGTTVFDGVPTLTCIAIGPHYVEEFVGVTDHLELY